MIRAVAQYDPARAAVIDATWPVRDGLLAFEQHLKRDALAEFRHAQLQYAVIAPHLKKHSDVKPPPVPALLRD